MIKGCVIFWLILIGEYTISVVIEQYNLVHFLVTLGIKVSTGLKVITSHIAGLSFSLCGISSVRIYPKEPDLSNVGTFQIPRLPPFATKLVHKIQFREVAVGIYTIAKATP